MIADRVPSRARGAARRSCTGPPPGKPSKLPATRMGETAHHGYIVRVAPRDPTMTPTVQERRAITTPTAPVRFRLPVEQGSTKRLPLIPARAAMRVSTRAWPGTCSLPKVSISTPSTVRRCDRPRRLPSFAAVSGVAGVLAAGLIRDNLQAHLAPGRVGEQPPSSTPTSLPVRTIFDSDVEPVERDACFLGRGAARLGGCLLGSS